MVRGAAGFNPSVPRFIGLSFALRQHSRISQFEQSSGRRPRRIPALLPILHRPHRYPEQVSELRLTEFEFRADALYILCFHSRMLYG